ncbi:MULTISPECIES: hypothetical protein [Phyllobacteriaceae]|uniref:Uncharacterized protein n=1 Tax=Mesorhizobium intechi TaxID=537601 RepID=A0A8T9AJ03_9HYPH|nr:hypothetical protein [Mesorhizobium intechi]TSE03355.1 hypothetical protein C1D09_026505 [Mesorhizobium intechi]
MPLGEPLAGLNATEKAEVADKIEMLRPTMFQFYWSSTTIRDASLRPDRSSRSELRNTSDPKHLARWRSEWPYRPEMCLAWQPPPQTIVDLQILGALCNLADHVSINGADQLASNGRRLLFGRRT